MRLIPRDRKQFLFLILMMVGMLLLLFVILSVKPQHILAALRSSRLSFIVGAIFIFLINLHLRSLRWYFWLYWKKFPIQWRRLIPCYLTNVLFNNFTPARSGEAIAPFLLENYCGLPRRYGFSLIILDRTIEAIIFLFIMIMVSQSLLNKNIALAGSSVSNLLFIFCILLTAFLGGIIFLLLKINDIVNWLIGFGQKHTGKMGKIIKKIAQWTKSLAEAAQEIASKRTLLVCIGLTLLSWGLEFFYLFLLVNSIVHITFLHSLFCQSLAISAAFFSLIPGGIGIGAAGYLSSAILLGYPKASIGAAVVLNSFLIHSIKLILGIISFFALQYRKGKTG